MIIQDKIMNKHFAYRDGILYCENIPVSEITNSMETPLYIYSKAILREKYQELSKAFSKINTRICFSVKSSPTLAVLQTLSDMGSGFDIVSGGELFRVVNAGGDPSKVVYSGVGKTESEIRYSLEMGIFLFNVESEEELAYINKTAIEMDLIAPVGIRLNPDVDPKTHRKTTTGKIENKFGIDFDSAGKIIQNLDSYENVHLKSLGVHLGSPINSTEPYTKALEKILDFMADYSDYKGIEYIDVGGGFGLVYNDEIVPDFADYADAIVPYIKKANCRLIIEPGRCIAGNAGILAGTVLYRKSNGFKNFVIADIGMHSLIRPAMYNSYHGIWPIESDISPVLPAGKPLDNRTLEPIDLVGPICESSDILCKDRPLPVMEQGDLVAVFSAGAYGFTMSFNYNSHPRPAEVMVDGSSWHVIHKPENREDLVLREFLL